MQYTTIHKHHTHMYNAVSSVSQSSSVYTAITLIHFRVSIESDICHIRTELSLTAQPRQFLLRWNLKAYCA